MDMIGSDYTTDFAHANRNKRSKIPKRVLGYQLDAVKPNRANSIPSE